MGRVKGCINPKCVANKKKIKYKEADDYCSKCGNKLYNICEKCHMQLSDSSEKFCVRCLAEKQDNKDQAIGQVKKVGVAALGIILIGPGKKVISTILKLK